MKSIPEYFDMSKEVESEEYDPNADNPRSNFKTEDAEEERVKKKCINYSKVNKRRIIEFERAMLAISYIKSITGKSTKVQATTRTAEEGALQILIDSH